MIDRIEYTASSNSSRFARMIERVSTIGRIPAEKPVKHTENDFRAYKQFAIKAARELHYGRDVVNSIYEAKSEAQITRILHDARTKN